FHVVTSPQIGQTPRPTTADGRLTSPSTWPLGEFLYTSGTAVYTPVVDRVSNKVAITVEVIQISGTTPTLDIDIEHKNGVDSSWSTAASFTQMTTAGVYSKSATGLKEQIRLKLTQGGSSASSRIFVFHPSWTD